MSQAGDALRDFVAPRLPSWRLQFGRWIDGTKTDRYCVIRPVGGLPADLVREPQFSVMLIAGLNDAASVSSDAADLLIEAMRAAAFDGAPLVSLQPAEPVFWATDDGRPVSEFAVSAIMN